ncbi:MAG: pitrilysin family protein [Pseudomonadota bacterium]
MSRLFIAGYAALVMSAPAHAAVDIKEVTSPGGITAWLVEEHQIPFVAIEIEFEGGASLDPDGKRGAVNLMTGLLNEGAGDMNAQEFAAAQEALAASFSFDVYDDGITISGRFLTENQDEAVALLRTALTEPSFDPAALERVRGQALAAIRSDSQDPDEIAARRFKELTYGAHPYATPYEGTLESVGALSRDDMITVHQSTMTKDKINVAVVGDITADELGTMLDVLLGGLPETGAPLPGKAELTFSGGIDVVQFETPQSVALFGHSGIEWDDPDFFAAFVLNTIVGAGGFESRLMQEVREKRGLTYGIYASLATRDHAELMRGGFASANDRISEAIDVIKAEWEKIATEGVTEEELELAKTYMTGSYPLRFDGNARIAGILASMQADDFPIDYALTRNDRVNAVTMEDIKRVAARLYNPDELSFVVVGQPVGLDPTN